MTYPATIPDTPVYGGADTVFAELVSVKDSNLNPIDLTGYTLTAEWRIKPESPISVALIVTPVDLAGGTFKVTASAAATESMGRSGVWDVRGVHATEGVAYFLRGTTSWLGSVTRG